ncbi:Hypothetical protein Cp262_2131 [Corynebacterium pseudotuberculosis]|nr:Hypothetical protein CPI37_0558 [Corynebacterium pseudotuberculosis]ARX64231.1 Hypothetical protein Cp262_2131 [Corynebacterium pseudotuberculosis]
MIFPIGITGTPDHYYSLQPVPKKLIFICKKSFYSPL